MTLRLLLLLAALPLLAAGPEWQVARPGYRYQFPRDHFAHPEFKTEWWYYTGNVHDSGGHRYGFELVFFRQGRHRGASDNPSRWRVDDLYLAHIALTDIDAPNFRSERRLNRAGPGLAGADPATGRVWNGNWDVRLSADGTQTLTAVAHGIRLALNLRALTPPVVHGTDGISRKAAEEGRASHYVSLPRLSVTGTLNAHAVAGLAWMDHEWFTTQLDAAQTGWDWFSVQLDNSTELMLFELRRADGSIDPYSSGTFIDRDGRARHLDRSAFTLTPVAWWTSPRTGTRYPTTWRITVPSLSLALDCAAAVPAQELVSEDGRAPTYWEGAVAYTGSATGAGYLEMTGYGKPFRFE